MNKVLGIYTTGVYGKTSDEFFADLVNNKIDLLIDVRHRRGVRGKLYSFANSNRLQAKLDDLQIKYHHAKHLAPTPEIRNLQKEIDRKSKVKKRERETIDNAFEERYRQEILTSEAISILLTDIDPLLDQNDSASVCFLCVENSPAACHRSIIADEMQDKYGFKVTHL